MFYNIDREDMLKKRILRFLSSFVAGFVSVLLFHQPVLALLYSIGFIPFSPYPIAPTSPFGIPQIWSSALWGGVWGIVLSTLIFRVRRGWRYWLTIFLFSAVAVTAVFLFIVLPLRGQPFAGEWQPNLIATGLMVNGAWGLGTALLMQWLPNLNPRAISRKIRLKILVTSGLIVLWALAVIAVVFVEAFWLARPAAPRGDLAAIENYLVQNLSQATAQKLGSAALILVQGDEIAAEHSFGVADAETQTPVKFNQTLYQLASVSKVVSAWGVMKLVQEGTLALDEPVLPHLTRWQFPAGDAHRNEVTVRHLMSHTAGLEDGFGYDGFLPGDTIQTLEESLTLTQNPSAGEPRGVTVAKEPGKAWYYSGGGYTVLQLLIEEVTKRSFADYMAEAVLQPLGMIGASFDWETISSEGRAGDIATSFDAKLKPSAHRRYTATAAASLYATPQDMAQFIRAYAGENPVLSQESLDQMMRPQSGTDNIRGWGLGHHLYVENDAGGYVVGHDGGNSPALSSTVRVNPATGDGIVLMISGNLRLANQLGDDWVYWETGKLSFFARMGILGSRLGPGLVAVIFGASMIVIVRWKSLK